MTDRIDDVIFFGIKTGENFFGQNTWAVLTAEPVPQLDQNIAGDGIPLFNRLFAKHIRKGIILKAPLLKIAGGLPLPDPFLPVSPMITAKQCLF